MLAEKSIGRVCPRPQHNVPLLSRKMGGNRLKYTMDSGGQWFAICYVLPVLTPPLRPCFLSSFPSQNGRGGKGPKTQQMGNHCLPLSTTVLPRLTHEFCDFFFARYESFCCCYLLSHTQIIFRIDHSSFFIDNPISVSPVFISHPSVAAGPKIVMVKLPLEAGAQPLSATDAWLSRCR